MISNSIAQALREARSAAKLTQREVSLRTGIAQPDISKLENGIASPSLRTLQRLAEELNLEIHLIPKNKIRKEDTPCSPSMSAISSDS